MYVACIQMEILPQFRDAFISATMEMARKSLEEPGNLRYDFFQSTENPNIFMLNEVYRDVEGMVDHKRASHYLRWRDEVESWCTKARDRKDYYTVFPETAEGWKSRVLEDRVMDSRR